jgi:hypothetical protein
MVSAAFDQMALLAKIVSRVIKNTLFTPAGETKVWEIPLPGRNIEDLSDLLNRTTLAIDDYWRIL